MTKAQAVLKKARAYASTVETWADFSNFLYNPVNGLLSTGFSLGTERNVFRKSKEYREIQGLMDEVTERTGLIEGASPKKSGRFVVRLPQSLHAALEQEARHEGVSLNQLVLTKLAVQLHKAVGAGRK